MAQLQCQHSCLLTKPGSLMTSWPKAQYASNSNTDFSSTIHNVINTHKPGGTKVDVLNLLSIVEKVLFQNHDGPRGSHPEVSSEIMELSCEIACNCSNMDLEARIITFLKSLSKYSWDAKMAIIVAAFVVHYGEFRLLLDYSTMSPAAANMVILKKITDVEKLRASVEEISEIIKKAIDVIRFVVQFNGYPSVVNEMTYCFAEVAYWIICTVIDCTTYIAALQSRNHSTIAKTKAALLGLDEKMTNFSEALQKQLSDYKQEFDDLKNFINIFNVYKEINQEFINIFRLFFEKGKQPDLVVGKNDERKVDLDILKDTNVLLLISAFNTGEQEIKSLVAFYETQTKKKYELVCLPVDYMSSEEIYSRLKYLMPWYKVQRPSDINRGFIRYIKEHWGFTHQTIVVPFFKGVIPSPYPLGYLWMFESDEQIFTKDQIAPWEKSHLTLKLLLDGIYSVDDPSNQEPFMCLFGGEDIKWIEEFYKLICIVQRIAHFRISMVYVSRKEVMDSDNEAISKFVRYNMNCDYWRGDGTSSWLFWSKVESIFTFGAHNNKNPRDHNIMKELMTLLDFKASFRGWALFGRLGSSGKIVTANARILDVVLKNVGRWREICKVDANEFLYELNNQIHDEVNRQPHHCNHITLSVAMANLVDDVMICATCSCRMDKSLTYHCCK